jgi:hypothetical protein
MAGHGKTTGRPEPVIQRLMTCEFRSLAEGYDSITGQPGAALQIVL